MKDRDTNQVRAEVVEATDGSTLQGFVERNAQAEATVYTDEARAYQGLPALFYRHESVRAVSDYGNMAHINGMESFWATLKRGCIRVYHKMSPMHLGRYVSEFNGRHNIRRDDTRMYMARVVEGMVGKCLCCHIILIADNDLPSGVRS